MKVWNNIFLLFVLGDFCQAQTTFSHEYRMSKPEDWNKAPTEMFLQLFERPDFYFAQGYINPGDTIYNNFTFFDKQTGDILKTIDLTSLYPGSCTVLGGESGLIDEYGFPEIHIRHFYPGGTCGFYIPEDYVAPIHGLKMYEIDNEMNLNYLFDVYDHFNFPNNTTVDMIQNGSGMIQFYTQNDDKVIRSLNSDDNVMWSTVIVGGSDARITEVNDVILLLYYKLVVYIDKSSGKVIKELEINDYGQQLINGYVTSGKNNLISMYLDEYEIDRRSHFQYVITSLNDYKVDTLFSFENGSERVFKMIASEYGDGIFFIGKKIMKYDLSGNKIFELDFNRDEEDNIDFFSLIETEDGGLLLGGVNWGGDYQARSLLIKTDCMGNQEWNSDNCINVSNNETFELYPNPVNDLITINFSEFEIGQEISFNVFDVVGKNVQVYEMVGQETIYLNFENLAPGVYIYQLFAGSELLGTGKFVKQ